jgi:hypothetical protein
MGPGMRLLTSSVEVRPYPAGHSRMPVWVDVARVRKGDRHIHAEEVVVPSKKANVKNEDQYEALKDKGMSKQRAAKIANSPGASERGGKSSGSGGDSSQGGTTAQKKKAGRKGGKASNSG